MFWHKLRNERLTAHQLGLILVLAVLWIVPKPAWAQACQPSPALRDALAGPNREEVLLVCRSEGNCDANGNVTLHYCGHTDPGDGQWNQGFCSYSPARGGPRANDLNAHDTICLFDYVMPALAEYNRCGFTTPLTEEERNLIKMTFIDLQVQAPAAADYLCRCLTNPNFRPTPPPPNTTCGANTDDPLLRARMCTFTRADGTLATPGFAQCNNKTTDQCNDFWCDQNRRQRELSGDTTLPPSFQENHAFNSSANKQNRDATSIYEAINTTCFACPIVGRVFGAGMQYGERVYKTVARSVVSVIAVGLVLWFLYQGAKILFPFGAQEKITNVGNQVVMRLFFAALISGLLLADTAGGNENTGYSFFWGYIVKPIVGAGINAGDLLLNNAARETYDFLGHPESRNQYCRPLQMPNLDDDLHDMKDRLECQVHNIQRAFSSGLGIGVASVLDGGLPNLLAGIILIFAFAAPIIKFAFTLIDAIFRYALVTIMSPVLLAAYIFPSTRSYSMVGVKALLDATKSVVLVAIVAAITASLMTQAAVQIAKYNEQFRDVLKLSGEQLAAEIDNMTQQNDNNAAPDGDATIQGLDPITFRPHQARVQNNNGAAPKIGVQLIHPTPQCPQTSAFGPRGSGMHRGIDYGCPIGTPIRAAADGIITYCQSDAGYGLFTVIQHADNVGTLYAHLVRLDCRLGQQVRQGDIIGFTGNTGRSTGPHLHFEVYVNMQTVDPAPFLAGQAAAGAHQNLADIHIESTGLNLASGSDASYKPVSILDPVFWILMTIGLFSFWQMKSIEGIVPLTMLGGGIAQGLGAFASSTLGVAGGIIGKSANVVAGAAGGIAGSAAGVSFAMNAGNAAAGAAAAMGNTATNAVDSATKPIRDAFGNTLNAFRRTVPLGNEMIDTLKNAAGVVQATTKNMVDTTQRVANTIAENPVARGAGSVGKEVLGGIAAVTMRTAAGTVAQVASSAANQMGIPVGEAGRSGAGLFASYKQGYEKSQKAGLYYNRAVAVSDKLAKHVENCVQRYQDISDSNSPHYIENITVRQNAQILLDTKMRHAEMVQEAVAVAVRDSGGKFDERLHRLVENLNHDSAYMRGDKSVDIKKAMENYLEKQRKEIDGYKKAVANSGSNYIKDDNKLAKVAEAAAVFAAAGKKWEKTSQAASANFSRTVTSDSTAKPREAFEGMADAKSAKEKEESNNQRKPQTKQSRFREEEITEAQERIQNDIQQKKTQEKLLEDLRKREELREQQIENLKKLIEEDAATIDKDDPRLRILQRLQEEEASAKMQRRALENAIQNNTQDAVALAQKYGIPLSNEQRQALNSKQNQPNNKPKGDV